MIRLIASDIDGTLVNDEKKMPPDFDEIINELKKRNITFAVSSGRSYAALAKQFENYGSDIAYICDNGAYVVYNNDVISRSIMSHNVVDEIITICDKYSLEILLCAQNGTYYNSKSIDYADEVKNYYNNCIYLENLHDCSDEVFKIAIYSKNDIEKIGYPELVRHFKDSLTLQLSGKHWVDIMNPDISKGKGIKILQNILGIGYEETMSFGDYLNDLEMLKNSYYSFAMSNAHPVIKTAANFFTGSNNDFSVISEIRRLVIDR